MNFGKIQFEVDILLSKLSVEWMVRVLHPAWCAGCLAVSGRLGVVRS